MCIHRIGAGLRSSCSESIFFMFGFSLLLTATFNRLVVGRSEAAHLLNVFRIPSALHRNFRGGVFYFTQIVSRELDSSRANILVQPRQLGCARDRYNPRLLREQPRKRYLSGSRLLLLRDFAKQVNQRLIRFPSFRREAREGAAEVRAVEFCIFINLSRQEALTQRAVRNEADSEFFKGGQHFLFRFAEPKRVFALDSGDWLNRVCATDRLCCRFRHAEVLYLALLNQFLHGARHVFNGHVGVNTVLIEQIDSFYLESFQRVLCHLLDTLWTAIQTYET